MKFWRSYTLRNTPFVHPKDRESLGGFVTELFCPKLDSRLPDKMKWFDIQGLDSENKSLFHSCIRPTPYVGNLAKADVLLLMTNPGLSLADHYCECVGKFPDFIEALNNTISQRELDREYPFMFLDPAFAFHPGFSYWHSRFSRLVEKILKRSNLPITGNIVNRALRQIAKKVACLELVPYHSTTSKIQTKLLQLQSLKFAKAFVHTKLADSNDSTRIFILRSKKHWLDDIDKKTVKMNKGRLFDLTKSAARGGHLTHQKLCDEFKSCVIDSIG